MEAAEHALETGLFPAQGGPLGNAWARAKKDSPALARDYDAVGKKVPVQTKFRLDWIKREYLPSCRKRTRKTTQKSTKRSHGTFLPPNMIWVEQGRGKAGLKAMKNLVTMAIMVGSKYCSWNSGTRGLELMHIKKGFSEELETAWALKVEQSEKTGDKAPTTPF